MKTTYTITQLRQIERIAEQAGIDLMQRAARSVADWVSIHHTAKAPILLAVGTGNNGGDALWAALNLHARDYTVSLWIPKPVQSSDSLKALMLCRDNQLTEISQLSELPQPPDLVIDGLFGIGLNRSLSNDWQQVIDQLNQLNRPTLALDTPSGFDAYTDVVYGGVIQATTTLTFLSDKPALHSSNGKKYAGKVIVDKLDLPQSMQPKAF